MMTREGHRLKRELMGERPKGMVLREGPKFVTAGGRVMIGRQKQRNRKKIKMKNKYGRHNGERGRG